MDGALLRLVFFFLNWWLLVLPIGKVGAATLYIFTLSVGYICLLMAGVWMSRLLKNNLMDDVFNTENEPKFNTHLRLIVAVTILSSFFLWVLCPTNFILFEW